MFKKNRPGFETLEGRLCLAVTAAVTDGDLVISGDADGAVEIVAVSQGSFRVTDNGVLIADETTLTGVDDDINIKLEQSIDNSNDTVSINLAGTTVDKIYADLGGGDNSFEVTAGTAGGLTYRGGDGIDSVALAAAIESRALILLGNGDNDLTVTGEVGGLSVHGGNGADLVSISETAVVNGGVNAALGAGDNSLTLAGSVEGQLLVAAKDGVDAVTITESASLGRSAKISLGDGDNSATVAGTVAGNVAYDGRDGNDTVTLTETAAIAGSFSARLGEGENSVTQNGNVAGDFRVVSANENDTVDIADTAVIGGETQLGLGEQTESRGCGTGREFGELQLGGRRLGFFFRGARR